MLKRPGSCEGDMEDLYDFVGGGEGGHGGRGISRIYTTRDKCKKWEIKGCEVKNKELRKKGGRGRQCAL